MALSFQHRFVASLMMMSLVVFVLTVATRNLGLTKSDENEVELTSYSLTKPKAELLDAVKLPHPEDRIPLDDPWNQATVIAVGLLSECLAPLERRYGVPVRVQIGEQGVVEASIEALPEDVEGRLECFSAALHANPWPPLSGEIRTLSFWVPPTVEEG